MNNKLAPDEVSLVIIYKKFMKDQGWDVNNPPEDIVEVWFEFRDEIYPRSEWQYDLEDRPNIIKKIA